MPNLAGFKLQAYQLSFSTDTRYFKDMMEASLLLSPKATVSTERQARDVGMKQQDEVSKKGPWEPGMGRALPSSQTYAPGLLPHHTITDDESVSRGLGELKCVTYGIMGLWRSLEGTKIYIF